MSSTTTADAILRLMESYGIDTIFSIPGIHTIEFYRSLPERAIRHVTPRHEQGGAFMAYGYAFASGKPACCMLITGPGVLNAATGVAEAKSDSIPMLVIAANNLIAELGVGRGALHETRSQAAVQDQVAAFTHSLLHPANIEEVFHRAMSHIGAGRPQPVLIEVPRDLLAAPAPVPSGRKPAVFRPAPDTGAVRQASVLLGSAQNPVILAGGGARNAGLQIQALAERTGAVIVTTNTGKGLVPEQHPQSIGSSLPFSPTHALLGSADVVLAIGTEMSETDLLYTAKGYRLHGTLIRVDIDLSQLTRNYQPDLAILSDATRFTEAVLAELPDTDGSKATRGAERASALRADLTGEWSAEANRHKQVLDVLAGVLAEDAVICADSTQLAYTGNHYWPSRKPGGWLFPNGYGTLGSALPAAIGARIACPTRDVLAIVGDGSFLYTIEELATAVEAGVGFPVIVWNNRAYGEIRDAMVQAQIPTVGVDLYTPDFLAIAKGFGCFATRPESLGELATAVHAALQRKMPTVIVIDNDGPLFSLGRLQ
jgi:thiamine pyrophosphate-dependent acetolactate synthase large subunit-like protein